MAFKTKIKGGGAYFKGKDYLKAVAILVEPLEFRADQPNGNFPGTRDIVVADVTVFVNADALNGDVEPTIIKRAQISGKGLTSDLEGEEGNQLVYGLAMKPSKTPGYQPFAVWRELDESITEKVQAYYEKREADVQAAMSVDLDAMFADAS